MLLTENDINEIQGWMRQAGQIALQRQSSLRMELKADHTPVTDAEFQIENFMLKNIHARFPAHQILTEEQGVSYEPGDFLWALDPIDGTKPYLRGLPTWGVSLGLLLKAKPVAGFFYVPALDEMFWGGAEGAFYNGRPLTAHFFSEESLTFLAVPANAHLRYEIEFPRLQAYGSTALHLSFLARGIAAGVLTRRVNLWDIAGFLPTFDRLGIIYRYLSGRPVEIEPLLGGQKTPEPILAGYPQWIETLQAKIHPRK